MRLAMMVLPSLLGCSAGLTANNLVLDTDDTAIDVPDPGDTDGPGPIEEENEAPLADAGRDQTVSQGEVVDLDGTGSSDPDGDSITYAWELVRQPGGSSTSIIDDHRASAQIWVDEPGEYVLRLVVDDGDLDDDDEVIVTAEETNGAPVANAGSDQSVSEGSTVQLNGTQSFDPDGDPLTYRWQISTKPTGSRSNLDQGTSATPRFVADVAGTYEMSLIVSDGSFSSSPDTVRVTAQAASDGDCLSCAAEVEQRARVRLSAGDLASGPALVLLPVLALLGQRRRRRQA